MGAQISGFANATLADNEGLQLSGWANLTWGTQRGWQISNLYFARRVVGGYQLGVANYADSSTTTPIGLLSYVHRGGYPRVELAADEAFPLNLTFRTGTRSFYTLSAAGLNPFPTRNLLWRAGFGLGRSWRLSRSRRWWLNSEIVAYDVAEPDFDEFSTGLFKLNPLVEREFGRHWAVAAGPTLNLYTRAATDSRYLPTFTTQVPDFTSWKSDYGFGETLNWVGLHAGRRWRW